MFLGKYLRTSERVNGVKWLARHKMLIRRTEGGGKGGKQRHTETQRDPGAGTEREAEGHD